MKTPTRAWKSAVYAQFALVGKALCSAPRLEILDVLLQAERTVELLAGEVGQSVANTSHHLQGLRRARLVEGDKQGTRVLYRLADEDVCTFYRSLRQLAESRLLEIHAVTKQFLEDWGAFEPVDLEALITQVRRGEVTVLDVRPTEEYEAGHIPGAVSVPLKELKRRISDLPRTREIVAYCRGPYCVMAVEAVALLRRKGFKAVRLEEGVADWRARGLRVEVSGEPLSRKQRDVSRARGGMK
jgi:rhodanese-related sulfurtransferase